MRSLTITPRRKELTDEHRRDRRALGAVLITICAWHRWRWWERLIGRRVVLADDGAKDGRVSHGCCRECALVEALACRVYLEAERRHTVGDLERLVTK